MTTHTHAHTHAVEWTGRLYRGVQSMGVEMPRGRCPEKHHKYILNRNATKVLSKVDIATSLNKLLTFTGVVLVGRSDKLRECQSCCSKQFTDELQLLSKYLMSAGICVFRSGSSA